jgi:hypothetical protein
MLMDGLAHRRTWLADNYDWLLCLIDRPIDHWLRLNISRS